MSEITIVEVSPRDGFQNDPQPISTADKVSLIKKLTKAGLKHIEVTSFVHPKKVPQMADAEAVLDKLKNDPSFKKTVLIPNDKGYERARNSYVDEVNWVSAATNTFNEKNIGMSIETNDQLFQPVITKAKEDKSHVCYSVA